MNCKNCNSPLESETRFCPRCGISAAGNADISGAGPTLPATPMQPRPIEAETTLITPQQSMPQVINPLSSSQQPQQIGQTGLPRPGNNAQSGAPIPYSQPWASPYPPQDQQSPFIQTESLYPNQIARGAQMQAVAMNAQAQQGRRAGRRKFGGCFLSIIAVLVVLLATVAGMWLLVIRPTVHGIVVNKLDNTMTQTVNRISPFASQADLPPGSLPNVTLPVRESLLENLIKLNIAPSDPVQDPVVHIDTQGVRLEFTAHSNFLPFNFPCAVSFVPALDDQGNIVARNTHIEGIANLVISSDELTSLLNRHFTDAVNKINHPISSIQLQQGEVDITLK